MPREPLDRARAAIRDALRLARADRELARMGEDRITARPAASSKPPAAAKSNGEKPLDKAKTPLPAHVQ